MTWPLQGSVMCSVGDVFWVCFPSGVAPVSDSVIGATQSKLCLCAI